MESVPDEPLLLFLYDCVLKRYSFLVLFPVADDAERIRAVAWITDTGDDVDDAAPRMLVNELNYRQLSQGADRVLVQNVPATETTAHGAFSYAVNFAEMRRAGYDYADHLRALARGLVTQAIMAKNGSDDTEFSFEAPYIDYMTETRRRWPPLLLYQGLLREAMGHEQHIAIASPLQLDDEESALEENFVKRADRWYVRPDYHAEQVYSPLEIEFDGTLYELRLYPEAWDAPRAPNSEPPIQLRGQQPWHSAFHLMHIVATLAQRGARWARQAMAIESKTERRRYVREKLTSLQPFASITDQIRYDATRLQSLQMSRIYALRWTMMYPEQYPYGEEPQRNAAKRPRGTGRSADETVANAFIVLKIVRERLGPHTEKELAAEMMALYRAKLTEKREQRPEQSSSSTSTISESDEDSDSM